MKMTIVMSVTTQGTMNKLIFFGLTTPILMLLVPNVYASDRDCEQEPNHELCNGDRGRHGMVFCDLVGEPDSGDCYSRNYERRDCKSITATIPTSTKQRSVTHLSSQKPNLSG